MYYNLLFNELVCWFSLIIPAFRRLRLQEQEFEASLGIE
jgi:hypothetical protein